MEFQKVRWQNFLSYGNKVTELDLNTNQSVSISGVNGHGKSVLLDVMHFVLIGKPFRKINVGQLVNTTNKKKCLTELYLKHNGKYVLIRRGLSPKIFEIFIDSVPITKNTKPIDADSKSLDQQKWLETFLNINSKTLKYTLFISSTNYTPFLQMTAADKRLFIEDILNIEIFSKILRALKIDFNVVKETLSECEKTFEKIESNIKLIEEMNEKQIKKSTETNETLIKEEQDRIEQCKQRIENMKSGVNTLSNEIEELRKSIICNDAELSNLEREVSEIQEEKKILESKKQELNKLYTEQLNKYNDNKSKGDKAIWKTTNDIKIESKEKQFFEENDSCPTCRHELTEEYKNQIIKEIDENIIKLKTLQEKQNIAYDKLKEFKQKIDTLNDKIQETSKQCLDVLNKTSNISHKMDIIRTEKRSNSKLIDEKENTIKKYNESRDSILLDIDKITKKIEELKKPKEKKELELKDTSELKTELQTAKNKIIEINNEKMTYEFAFQLLSDDGIKKYIIKKYIPLLNKYVNKFLDVFQAHYRLMFNEMLDETIAIKNYESLSYNSLSAGERARCDLSLLFAFLSISKSKEHVSSNIIILDEVADSNLDKDGIDGLIEIIAQLKSKGYTIFIISHRGELMNVFDITYQAVKNQFSYLEKV